MLKICNRSLKQVLNLNNAKYICFPTNLYLTKNETCYLFGKCYQQIKYHMPNIIPLYSQMLKNGVDNVSMIGACGYNIVLSFPTRQHWHRSTNLSIVKRSCCELLIMQQNEQLIENADIYLPLQIDGITNFTLDDMIDEITPILSQIKNLQIIYL